MKKILKRCAVLAVAALATTTMAIAVSAASGQVGNPPTYYYTNTNKTSTGVTASLSTSGATPSSTSVKAYCTFRVPSGGPEVTVSSSGTVYAVASAYSGCTVVSGRAEYSVTSGGETATVTEKAS